MKNKKEFGKGGMMLLITNVQGREGRTWEIFSNFNKLKGGVKR